MRVSKKERKERQNLPLKPCVPCVLHELSSEPHVQPSEPRILVENHTGGLPPMMGWGCCCCCCCCLASSDVPCPCPWHARHWAGRGSRDLQGTQHPGRMQRRQDERVRPDVCLLQLVLLVSPTRKCKWNVRTTFCMRRRGIFSALPLLCVRRRRAWIMLALGFRTRSLARWLRGFLLGRGRGTMSQKRGSRQSARRRGTRSGSTRLSWARTKGDI